MIFYSTLIIFLDIYFLSSWKRFIKKEKINILYFYIPLYISILMGFVSVYSVLIQVFDIIPGIIEREILFLQSIWYIPKFLIVPVLIAKDIIRHLRKYRLRQKEKLLILENLKIKPLNLFPQPALQTNINLITNLPKSSRKLANTQPQQTTNKERRNFLKNTSIALAGLPFYAITKDAFETTFEFEIRKVRIPILNLPDKFNNFTIVQLSDIHSGSFSSLEPIEWTVETINKLNPDLVVATGDFVNFKANEYDYISSVLSQMKSKYGLYGCLGNHDHFMDQDETYSLINKIEHTGMQILSNESVCIERNGEYLNLAGVDNFGYGQTYGDFKQALSNIKENVPTILLCHDPTNWDRTVRENFQVDLMLSGHTHGGQVGITFLGRTISPTTFVYKQHAGLYSENNKHLYINRGLGTSGVSVRIGIPPEITVIKLVKI